LQLFASYSSGRRSILPYLLKELILRILLRVGPSEFIQYVSGWGRVLLEFFSSFHPFFAHQRDWLSILVSKHLWSYTFLLEVASGVKCYVEALLFWKYAKRVATIICPWKIRYERVIVSTLVIACTSCDHNFRENCPFSIVDYVMVGGWNTQSMV